MQTSLISYEILRQNAIALFETHEYIFTRNSEIKLRHPRRGRHIEKLSPARATILISSANHAVTLLGTIIEILDNQRPLESAPLIRASYEGALQCQWVYLAGDDAANSLANEHGRLRRALQKEARESSSPYLREVSDDVGEANWQNIPANSDDQARSMQSMLRDIESGDELYVFYRFMSEYCHPSMLIVDQYISGLDEKNVYPTFQHSPKTEGASTWMYFSLLSACMSVYPVSTLIENKELRKEIGRIGRACDINYKLELSSHYYKRKKRTKG